MLSTPKRLRCRAVFLTLIVSFVAGPRTDAQVPELVTDRPDQTESSETVGPGYVQFEFGWTHSEDDDDADVTSDSFPETLIRVGVVDNLELRFGFGGYIREDVDGLGTEDGAGDLSVGLKWRLWEESGWRPQTAVLADTSVPTGQTPFSSERFDPSVRLACSHTLTETLGLGYNLAGIWSSEEDGGEDRDTTASIAYSVVLGVALSDRLGTFVELFGETPTDEGKPANSFDAGVTYLIADNLQIDVLGGVALSDAADDWFAGAGLVWRLPSMTSGVQAPHLGP